jgi:hypothetical protein
MQANSPTLKHRATSTLPYDVAEQSAYLDAWLEVAPDGATGITRALGDMARAKGDDIVSTLK